MPVKTPVHVACVTNSGYILPLCVMLASLVEHFDPARELVLHFLTSDATATDRESVSRTLELNRPGLANLEVHWYAYNPDLVAHLPELHATRETYARLFIPALLPVEIDRVIYLDCDLVILADLARLYDETTGPALVHAAHDIGTPFVSSAHGVFDFRARGLDPETRYFNAGVLVLNLEQWRDRRVSEEVLDYLSAHPREVFSHDQGALNAFLHHDWAPLDPRWNQGFDVLFPEMWRAAGHTQAEWRRALEHPYIVHFSGGKKPWQKGRRGPRYSYFFRYLRKTVFRDALPGHPRLESLIGVRAYYHLWRWARRMPGLAKP